MHTLCTFKFPEIALGACLITARMEKRWKINPVNKELQEELGRELNILPVTAQLLINRGLVDCDRAFSFLRPDLNNLYDPFLLKGMDSAVRRIVSAVTRGEKIAVYGDYDVDGTTSTALLHLFFREIGVDTLCYIPERCTEGYGLNAGAIKALHEKGVRLIITVDCGTSNHDEVDIARSLGIDCIITDHHEVSGDPPGACAFINPLQQGCGFPFKGLAGVGVAFNLMVALRAGLRDAGWFKDRIPNLKRYLDIVCIGTVADMVPLVDENRVLASFGLKELNNTGRAGLKALIDVCRIRRGKVTAENIAYQIAPRINAAGRMERADTALRLLVTGDEREAVELARRLDRENSSRQNVEERMRREAVEMVGDGSLNRAIVLSSDNWHPGVIGIVASRLVERFYRPVVLIAVEGETGKGSVRSIKGYNVMEGLRECSGLLERYGGHKAAAGLTVRRGRIDDFKKAYTELLNRTLSDDDLVPEVELDGIVSLDEVDARLVSEIERLAPFGRSNERPLLCATGTDIVHTEVVAKRHLRMMLRQSGRTRYAIAFDMAGSHPVKGGRFDVAFYPYMDEWNGSRNLRLNVKELKEQPQIP